VVQNNVNELESSLPLKKEFLELIEHYQLGRLSKAQLLAESITKEFPKNTFGWKILSAVYGKKGLKLKALDAAKKAAKLEPEDFEAHNNLGVILIELGRIKEAECSFRSATILHPDFAEAHNNLGVSLQKQGKLQDAEQSFSRVTALRPDLAEAHLNFAITSQALGKIEASISSYVEAIKLNPDHNGALANFGNALMKVRFKASATHLYPFLIKLLTQANSVRPSYVACSILSLLRHDSQINELFNRDANISDLKQLLTAIQILHEKPLLHNLIRLCPLPDLQFEQLFASMRKAFLLDLENISESEEIVNFLSSLSIQCFINEYVYSVTEEETELVKALEAKITKAIKETSKTQIVDVLTLALYRPLHSYNWCGELDILNPLKEVKKCLILEPLSERMLAQQIVRKGQISNKVSLKVRNQYEENPYPRWVKATIPLQKKSIADICDEINLKLHDENVKKTTKPVLLIAGCGTGQHSIETALRFSNCRVHALDLSLTSLCYAKRKSNELRLANLEYLQADILDLHDYEKKFDIIETVGVLHHMEEPMAGWSVLTNLLKPGGLMKVGLYSKLGRSHITKIRDTIARRKIEVTESNIRSFRSSLIKSHEKEDQKLIKTGDFFSLSNLRDAIFHVSEHCFTIPEIQDCMHKLELKFCGFEGLDLISQFQKTFGETANVYDLELWHKLEENEPETFNAMYQFWCQKA